jgi:hypothetical protein
MRVAVIVVTMLAVTTPSETSQSCISKTEARQHFGSSYIYWHGSDHCWDTTPPRHLQIQAPRKTLIQEVQRKSEPKWRDSMSEMLPNDEPVQSLRAQTSLDVERHESDGAVTGTPWADRWVNIEPPRTPFAARRVRIVQPAPPSTIEHEPEPIVSPHDVVLLAFIAFVLTLGVIEALYRNDL